MKKTILAIALLMSISLPVHAGWFSNLFGGEQLGSTINALPVFRVVSDTYAEFRNTAWELGASGSEIVKAWFSEICLGGDCRTSWPAGGGGSIDQLGQIGDVSTSTLAYGHVLTWDGSNWQDNATSTLGIDLSDTTGSITESRISDLGSYLLDSGDTATGNYNFDSGTLYVDASNNRVGMGTASPQSLFHLAASDYPSIRVSTSTTAGGANSFIFGLATGANNFVNGAVAGDTVIAARSGGDLIFGTNSTWGTSATEKLRVAGSGNVGIGVTSPQTTLDVNGIIRGGGGTTEANIQARNGQNIFRGLDGWTGTWSDSVATTYFQVGRNGGNTAFSSLYGALFNRLAFMTNKLQVTNGTGTLTPPTNFFQVDYNGDNKFSVTSAGLVGVTTSTPAAQLAVEGQGTVPSFMVSDSSNNTDFIITSAGLAGFGTANPQTQAHVYTNTASAQSIRMENASTSGYAEFYAKSNGATERVSYGVAGSAVGNALADYAYIYTDTGLNGLSINTNGSATPKMVINNSGNIGVGTVSPSSVSDKFIHVYSAGSAGYTLENAYNKWSFFVQNVTGSYGLYNHSLSDYAYIITDNDNHVGVATNTPFAQLSVEGQGTAPAFAVSDTSNNTDLIVDSSGNVGVSTTTPFTNFSVSGNAVITGSLYDNNFSDGNLGDVLQSTGSGYTWVATSTLGLGGSGGGSVTSVGMSVPTGLTISGSPITSAGTLAVGLDTGYLIPTSTRLVQHDTAYSWGDHSTQGYLTASPFGAAIDPTELASADFGDFTCNGTTCTLDTDYITEAELDTIAELQTQIADATLLISGGTLTTGNLCQYDGTGIDCNLSNTLHAAVTLAGEDYLSLSTQQITANAINPDNLAAADFGDFTCNGTTCSLDVAVGGDTGWSTSTAFGSQVILYPAGTTYDVLFGANSTTTAPFWWDVSATSTYIGNGGSGDSAVQLGDDNNAWTFGKDDTDGSFAIASSTTLGTDNLLTIQKNATTTLQNANGIDFTDGTNGMRIYFGGTTTTLEFY